MCVFKGIFFISYGRGDTKDKRIACWRVPIHEYFYKNLHVHLAHFENLQVKKLF